MRLAGYLTESMMDEVVEIIKKDCKPFLKEFGGTSPVLRGSPRTIYNIAEVKPRHDRTPTDTPKFLHDLIDSKFKKKFGWKPRSEGVFVTKDIIDAESYGKVYYFYPIGKYRYVYSPKIDDLYGQIRDDIIKVIDPESMLFTRHLEPENVTDEFEKLLDEMIDTYTDKGYNKKSKNVHESEAMFDCKSYYLVEKSILPTKAWSKVGEW